MIKKLRIAIIVVLIIVICLIAGIFNYKSNSQLRTIKSDKELLAIYNNDNYDYTHNSLIRIMTLPFNILGYLIDHLSYNYYGITDIASSTMTKDVYLTEAMQSNALSGETSSITSSRNKDYSTTNIQVENVDEADITKTDGDYIYSISDNNVIITNVINPEEIKIEATIKSNSSNVPEDLILYKDKLIVILTKTNSSTYYYSNNNDTIVRIYDISDKSTPKLVKSYELHEPYYTSRCINNTLYVISAGYLREENDKIDRTYMEDNSPKQIELDNIKYLKDLKTTNQTLISVVNLDDTKADINICSYLMDISNAYVSENSIYLLNQHYSYSYGVPPISSIFGLKGIIGAFTYDDDHDDYGYYTEIYKFGISTDGNVSYNTKTKIKGRTINQYSLDEQDNHLRIALYDDDGSRIAIFNENLNQIGISDYVAKGETMYSSRFMGNKAYLVTYRTMDPLFVIDLSDETSPKVLGELHIPGYSTYLHPYDENHLIGIGMETEEVVNRNSNGKVISTTSRIIGMKMALFDVSDVNNPKQLSQTVIGDRRTTSAILTNPKALLFSKSKELIAIPVNNYSDDFEVDSSSDSYSSTINSYTNYNKPYNAEGYFVYKINIEDGFNLKGVISHEVSKARYYYTQSKLLRGLYIDNNLFTVSETAVKVNSLDTLELVDELKIK